MTLFKLKVIKSISIIIKKNKQINKLEKLLKYNIKLIKIKIYLQSNCIIYLKEKKINNNKQSWLFQTCKKLSILLLYTIES